MTAIAQQPARQSDRTLGILIGACVSSAVLGLGALHTLAALFAERGTMSGSFVLDGGALWVTLLGAAVGRAGSIWIQSEVVVAAAHPISQTRSGRLSITRAVLISQWPIAVGDALLGVVAMTGVLSMNTLMSLAMSPFSPFLLMSVLVFRASLRSDPELRSVAVSRKALVTFVVFTYLVRLLIFAVSLAPQH